MFYRKVLRRPPPFGFCCDQHDVAYEEGGGWWDRWLADWRFAVCLWEDHKGGAVLVVRADWWRVVLGGMRG